MPLNQTLTDGEDEISALDDYRIPANGWAHHLHLYRVGKEAPVFVARRARLLRLPVTFGTRLETLWKLGPRSVPTASQNYRVDSWLGQGP